MMATIVLTKSRGGFLGLGAMLADARRQRPCASGRRSAWRPWWRCSRPSRWRPPRSGTGWSASSMRSSDTTGSRQARLDLLKEGVRVFAAHPVLGVGLGQFINYEPDERKEAWNVTHNAMLQVAAELGIVGLIPFLFVIGRAVLARRRRAARIAAARPSFGTPRTSRAARERPAPDRTRDATDARDSSRTGACSGGSSARCLRRSR